MRNAVELPESVRQGLASARSEALHAPSLEVLRGIEGQAAALYFQNFNRMLKGADAAETGEKKSETSEKKGEK